MTQSSLLSFWHKTGSFLQPFLKHLDPSLFQNIILGILAVFIPFAIVFLTDVLDPQKQRSEFEKMVLSIEVFGAKKVFWLSAVGIGTLAFFGKESSNFAKLLSITIALLLIFSLGRSFRKTLRFSEGHQQEFKIAFLKSLNLSRIFRFGNKRKSERMVSAWSSFWEKESKDDERDFTGAFITHIDKSLVNGKYGLAVQLSRSYVENLGKRTARSTVPGLLPKIFEWNEKFWNKEQSCTNRYDSSQEKRQKVSSPKHSPTFRKWALNISKKIRAEDELFLQWNYFREQMFPAVAKVLLHDQLGVSHLFSWFKKHVDESEEKLERVKNTGGKEKQWDYITELFSNFCPIFFENIKSVDKKVSVWKQNFPEDWKITMDNSQKRIPRVMLSEFDRWYRSAPQKDELGDDKASEIANGLFPNVDVNLFPLFLSLQVSDEIGEAIQREPRIRLMKMGESWSGEKSDAEIVEMFRQKELSEKRETVNIIFWFFPDWRPLKLFTEDLSAEEKINWKVYPEETRRFIVDRVRRHNLQRILDELNSSEVKEMCKDSEILESRRIGFIELVQSLLQHISN